MNPTKHLHRAISALCLGSLVIGACQSEPNEATSQEVEIQIRLHGDTADNQKQPFARLTDVLKAGEFTDVDRILVNVTYSSDGTPFIINFNLTQFAPNDWRGTLPFLPRNEELRFAARAYDVDDTEIFSGETLSTLTIDNEGVEIPLAPAQDEGTFDMPRMYRIVYPSEIVSGQEVQFIFTIEANAGETISYELTSDDGSSPFSPASGTVTMTNTVADFIILYTAPDVASNTDFGHKVMITSDQSSSSVAIETSFATTILPPAAGIDGVVNTEPYVLFNPVVMELTANGSINPGEVALDATISDDGDIGDITYAWSYQENMGTPAATFADNTANPVTMQGYTVGHQGTITLAVTDGNGGTTTLYYELMPDQFADAIDNGAVSGLKKIVAGNAHTCALTGEGKVRCWGDAQWGQLGYGNAQDIGDNATRLPHTAGDVPLPAAYPVRQLVAGDDHTCALLESGFVYCWGKNDLGQLGYGSTDHLADGEPVFSFGYVSIGGLATKIAANGQHTCAVLQGGTLRCWGNNAYGQLGHGHTNHIGDNENVFDAGNVDLGTGVVVTDVALGDNHTCALLQGGDVRCWGYNNYGQLGLGHNQNQGDNEAIDTLDNVSLPGPVRKLAAGNVHTCALMVNGAMRCWGHGYNGELGNASYNNTNYGDHTNEIPLNLPDIDTGAIVTDIAVGDNHTCALLSDGLLKCWGYNIYGQLGYGNTSELIVPSASGVDLDGVSAYQIAAGANYTCALRSNGTARCWGQGASGALGLGATGNIYSPAAGGDIQVLDP